MKSEEYIDACKRTEANPYGSAELSWDEMRIAHAILGLSDEAGELAKALKARMFYDRDFDEVNLVEEAGDAMWYLAILLDALGVSWEDVWEKNIAKLKTRYPERFTVEQANHRNLDAERQVLERSLKPDAGAD